MGTDAGDVDGDGWQDLFVTNLSNQPNELYRNLAGKGPFAVVSYAAGLAEPSLLMTGWGTAMFDYDNDGDLDIIVTNGHPMDDIETVSDVMTYAQRPNLYENDGRGRFTESRPPARLLLDPRRRPRSGVADYDNDGDLDVAINSNNCRRSCCATTAVRPRHGSRCAWSGAIGWDAPGAPVTLTAEARQLREACSARYMSQNDMRLRFGRAPHEGRRHRDRLADPGPQ
jgi:hypothetical protein